MTSCWLSALKIYGGLKRGIGISLYEGALTVTICVNLAVKFDRAVYLFCSTKSITIYMLKLKHHSRSFTEVSELYVMLTSRKPVHRTGSRVCITLKEHLPIVAKETCKFASHSRGIHSSKQKNVKQEKYQRNDVL